MGRVVTCGLWFAVLVLASSSVMGYETKSFQVYRVNPQARPKGLQGNRRRRGPLSPDPDDHLYAALVPRLCPRYRYSGRVHLSEFF